MIRRLLGCLLLAGCATSGFSTLPSAQQNDARRAQNYLATLQRVDADFVQTGPGEGQHSAGHLLYRPGELHLDYTIPHPMRLEAKKARLVMTDDVSGAVTHLSLRHNPLGFLLRAPLRFEDGIQVTDVRHDADSVQISLAEADDPSRGLLTLQFSERGGTLHLIGFQGVDGRNHRFSVLLHDVRENGRPVSADALTSGNAPVAAKEPQGG